MGYLSFNKVKKEYEVGNDIVKALDSVSFEIDEGTFNVVLGPSGSGKSTLLNLLGGMDSVTGGNIYVDNTDISELKSGALTKYRARDVGFVFQFYNLIASLNVYENVDMAGKLGRNPMGAAESLKAVGLEKRMKHFPAELSGGELQRTSIARAVCKNPKILLCDEPTGALDSETGKKILTLLQEMSTRYGKTVIVVTHNALIAPTADRVIRLKDGKIKTIEENNKPASVEEVEW